MLHRNILKELIAWKDNSERKPLILRGARQVGKTTIVEMFAKNFEQYINLNLAVRLYNGKLKIDHITTLNGKEYRLLNLPYYLRGQIEKYFDWIKFV